MRYILTENEFVTLLALGGLTCAYSVQLKDDIDDDDLVEAIYALYQRGWVVPQQETLVLSPLAEEIVGAMGRGDHVFVLSIPDTSSRQRLIYAAGPQRVLILEQVIAAGENTIQLQLRDIKELADEIGEDDLEAVIPENVRVKSSDPEAEELSGFDMVVFSLERRDLSQDTVSVALRIHMTASAYLLVETGREKDVTCPFSLSVFKELFQQMLREE